MMSEPDFLAPFERVRRIRDDEWMARCPAHCDRNPSLHVSRKDDRWLLHCHAGCALADVLAAARLELADLFEQNGNGGRDEEAVYRYTDEQGRPMFEVVRFTGKQFRQRTPDGTWGLNGTRRVLYRLPRILEAVDKGHSIFVVEGERDVHALERLGQYATCNPMGAGKWRPEYSEALRGADVVVVADRDDPGREHARAVAESLRGIAAEVGIVEFTHGKDA